MDGVVDVMGGNEPTLGEVYRLVESIKDEFAQHAKDDAAAMVDQDRKRHAAIDRLTPMFSTLDLRTHEHSRMLAVIEANVAMLSKANSRNATLLSGAMVTLLLDLLLKLWKP